ncbi:MAG: arsenosugar biosynthesis radical SAM protein ArsS, partial [Flavobacteriales bacterium]|nr:arsenosugar biosynthesis radical SAM protein ArsS [Flavobacteriales bacterium]
MATKSLKAREGELAEVDRQMEILHGEPFSTGDLPTFASKLKQCGKAPLRPTGIEIFQVNVGYMCNQVCNHCHVDAGPDRKEIMTRETMQQCLDLLQRTGAHTLDLTGGAPEMNPDFRWFVEEAAKLGVQDFIVRSNLTIMLANKKYHDLPEFFAKHGVHVVSSLPFYNRERTDKQRGDGVFEKSIEAIRMLNKVGYGQEGSGLKLDLVYNPAGAFLPAAQSDLERDFKQHLLDEFGLHFNGLFTITNLPISRFLDYLVASNNYEDYMYTLVDAFNPAAVDGVMCKNTLSVSWDGNLYDCDFNQMLGLKVASPSNHISNVDIDELNNRAIIIDQHCYGCTAGAGSSCQG